MTALVPARPIDRLRSVLASIRPRPRNRESALLILVAAALTVGSLSLGSTESWLGVRNGDIF